MIVDRIVKHLTTGYQKAWLSGDVLPGGSVDTATKIKVDDKVAMTYSACWAATLVLSDPISQMPIMVYKRTPDGERDEMREHELFDLLHTSPNSDMGSMAWRGTMTPQLINRGNCFSEIERNGDGSIKALWPIHYSRLTDGDDRLRYYRDKADRIWWIVRNDNGTETDIPDADMFHVVGALSDDGICGKGVIRQAAESIGVGLATERYGGSFFGNGARPSVVLTHPTKLGPDGKQNLRREWNSVYGGPNNANKIAILEGDTKLTGFSVNNDEAQFLETRQYNIQEICRWYRVSPHQLADLSRATFSNIEHLALEFVTYSLMPWIGRWEEAIRRKLISEADRKAGVFAEFNVEGLLRGDSTARANFYKLMLGMGIYNINTALKKENMKGIGPLGEVRFVPANMMTLENAVKPPEAKPAPGEDGENGDESEGQDEPKDPKGPGDDQMGKLAAIITANKKRLNTKLRNHATRLASDSAGFVSWLDDGDDWWTRFIDQLQSGIGDGDEAMAIAASHREKLSSLIQTTTADALPAAVASYFGDESNGALPQN